MYCKVYFSVFPFINHFYFLPIISSFLFHHEYIITVTFLHCSAIALCLVFGDSSLFGKILFLVILLYLERIFSNVP